MLRRSILGKMNVLDFLPIFWALLDSRLILFLFFKTLSEFFLLFWSLPRLFVFFSNSPWIVYLKDPPWILINPDYHGWHAPLPTGYGLEKQPIISESKA